MGTGGRLYIAAPHAGDEVPLPREEALQEDRERQAPGPPRVLEPHPREEVAQAQARDGAGPADLQGGPQDGHEAARGQRPMTRVKRSVHARKKRREVLERAKGFRGEAHSSYKRAKEALMKAHSYA